MPTAERVVTCIAPVPASAIDAARASARIRAPRLTDAPARRRQSPIASRRQALPCAESASCRARSGARHWQPSIRYPQASHSHLAWSRITRCTCAAAAVAARARRLNRLLAQAALVPHQEPAADGHHVLVRQRVARAHDEVRTSIAHPTPVTRRTLSTRHEMHLNRQLAIRPAGGVRDGTTRDCMLDHVPAKASCTNRRTSGDRPADAPPARLTGYGCPCSIIHDPIKLPHNALHMCCGRGGGASAATEQAPSTGRARAAPTPAADGHHVRVIRGVDTHHELKRERKLNPSRCLGGAALGSTIGPPVRSVHLAGAPKQRSAPLGIDSEPVCTYIDRCAAAQSRITRPRIVAAT